MEHLSCQPHHDPQLTHPRGSQPSSSKIKSNSFVPTQNTYHSSPGPSFLFHQFTNPLKINRKHGIHVPEREISSFPLPRNVQKKPISITCPIGQLLNEYAEEGSDKNFLLECAQFYTNYPQFTELAYIALVQILFCFGVSKKIIEHNVHQGRGSLWCSTKVRSFFTNNSDFYIPHKWMYMITPIITFTTQIPYAHRFPTPKC